MLNITLRRLTGRFINLGVARQNALRLNSKWCTVATNSWTPLVRSTRIAPSQPIHTSAGLWSIQVINVPPFADSITEGDAKFLVKLGAQVNVDEVVAEIETDKTTVPVPAPCKGIVKEFLVNDGDTVKPGQPLYKIETQ